MTEVSIWLRNTQLDHVAADVRPSQWQEQNGGEPPRQEVIDQGRDSRVFQRVPPRNQRINLRGGQYAVTRLPSQDEKTRKMFANATTVRIVHVVADRNDGVILTPEEERILAAAMPNVRTIEFQVDWFKDTNPAQWSHFFARVPILWPALSTWVWNVKYSEHFIATSPMFVHRPAILRFQYESEFEDWKNFLGTAEIARYFLSHLKQFETCRFELINLPVNHDWRQSPLVRDIASRSAYKLRTPCQWWADLVRSGFHLSSSLSLQVISTDVYNLKFDAEEIQAVREILALSRADLVHLSIWEEQREDHSWYDSVSTLDHLHSLAIRGQIDTDTLRGFRLPANLRRLYISELTRSLPISVEQEAHLIGELTSAWTRHPSVGQVWIGYFHGANAEGKSEEEDDLRRFELLNDWLNGLEKSLKSGEPGRQQIAVERGLERIAREAVPTIAGSIGPLLATVIKLAGIGEPMRLVG